MTHSIGIAMIFAMAVHSWDLSPSQKIFEFFRLKIVYSGLSLMRIVCKAGSVAAYVDEASDVRVTVNNFVWTAYMPVMECNAVKHGVLLSRDAKQVGMPVNFPHLWSTPRNASEPTASTSQFYSCHFCSIRFPENICPSIRDERSVSTLRIGVQDRNTLQMRRTSWLFTVSTQFHIFILSFHSQTDQQTCRSFRF